MSLSIIQKTLVFLNLNHITSYAYLQELERIPNHKTKVLSTKKQDGNGHCVQKHREQKS